MTENKTPWTPGPWVSLQRVSETLSADRWEVRHNEHGLVAMMSFPDVGCDQANARLISKAPQMAKLLEAHLYGQSAELNDRTYALLQFIKGEDA